MDTATWNKHRVGLPAAGLGWLAYVLWSLLAPVTSSASHLAAPALTPAVRAAAGMPGGMQRQLEEAFILANQTVEGVAACRELFAELDQPADRSLALTLYVPASGKQERRVCSRGVAAFTAVGSRVTYLCRDFGRLAAPRAASTLVHEALHLAGLEEAPLHPDAPSSAEINDLVTSSCKL